MTVSVCGLSSTPVKGTRVRTAERLSLGPGGVDQDRRFYVIDDRWRMLNGKQLGALSGVVSTWHENEGELELRFPDGSVVRAPARDGDDVQTRFYSRSRHERLVTGPFSERLSRYLGQPVALVRATAPAGAVDRGARGAVSLISRASLARLAAEADVDGVDARRFRMTIEVDGVPAHAEDRWVGQRLRIGSALVEVHGHVGRCLITSRDPETGTVDLPTLDVLAGYRGNVQATEPLPFGVYGEVLEPGDVMLGDAVALLTD